MAGFGAGRPGNLPVGSEVALTVGVAAVFFDVGGVLVHSDLERYAERAAGLLAVEPAQVRQEVGLRVRDLEKGELTSLRFWSEVAQALGRRIPARSSYRLWRGLMKDSLRLDLDLFMLCQQLTRQGVLLGVLSNVIEDHAGLLEQRGIYLPFSPCLISCRCGRRKPEPEFYRLAVARAGVAAGTCLLVDDNPDNLPPARAVGMRTHHYRDLPTLRQELGRHGLAGEPERADPWLVDERDFPWEGERLQQLLFCLRYAVLAPSSHNRQPWRFRLAEEAVEIEEDPTRTLPVADPRNREMVMSCGAAFHFLKVAAQHFGFAVREAPGRQGLRRLLVGEGPQRQAQEDLRLRAIPYQRSEWVAFESEPLAPGLLRALQRSVRGRAGVGLHWIEEPEPKRRLAERVLQAARGQWRDRMFRAEMADWLRPGPGRREGLAATSLGLPRAGYPLFWRLLPHYDIGSNLAVREAARAREAPLLVVITTRSDTRPSWFDSGAMLAELVLVARTLGVAAVPVHHPLESDPFRRGLEDLVPAGHPQVVLRLGYGPNVAPAPRRSPGEVLVH